jgi:exosortase
LSLLLVFFGFWVSWSRFPSVWTDDRNNGFAIAALTLWVSWRDRALLTRNGPKRDWALPLLFALSVLWMLSVAMSAQTVHITLLPVILLTWLFVVRGEKAARYGAEVAFLFSLALPIWGLLIPLLQALTVVVNRGLLLVTQIPARVEGSLIHLQAGTLHVANSCAGFNYLMVGLTIGACYAYLFTSEWKTRVKIILVAGAITIVSNWLRVFGLVVVGHVTNMRSSLMNDHVLYGWLIFAASVPLVFYVSGRIEHADRGHGHSHTVADLTSADRSAKQGVEPHENRLALPLVAALSGPILLFVLGAVQPQASMSEVVPGVALSDRFTADSLAIGSWTPAFDGERTHRRGTLTLQGTPVQLDRYLYAVGEDRAEMIGSENYLAADSVVATESLVGPLDDRLRMAREALLRTSDGNGRAVWYWYSVSGVVTPSPLRAKLLELWSFLSRKPASELTVLSAPCTAGDCRLARQALYHAASGRTIPSSPR